MISDYYYYRYVLENTFSEPGGKATGLRGVESSLCIASAERVCQRVQTSLEFNTGAYCWCRASMPGGPNLPGIQHESAGSSTHPCPLV